MAKKNDAAEPFKVKKVLTLPMIKLGIEVPKFLKFDGAFYQGRPQPETIDEKTGKKKKPMDPATLAHVTDLETGEQGTMIISHVLHGILEEGYPKDAYVGRSFRVVKHAQASGKRYNTFSVAEVEA